MVKEIVNKQPQAGQLRIIGGEWRGRKLLFPAVTDLRPTPDRVRETLFNWLQMQIAGSRCLDLFSGSGALGLESLSRGAREVVMVEQDRSAAAQIRQHLHTLNCRDGSVESSDAMGFLGATGTRFEIVFLDPPYRLNVLTQCCQLLEQNGWLSDNALIYLEDNAKNGTPTLPANWQLLHSKKAGDVGYHLAQRQGDAAAQNGAS